MNKSVRNGLVVGVITLALILLSSYFMFYENNRSKDWVLMKSEGDIQRVNIVTQNVSFNLPKLWQSMSNKEADNFAKFYGEYDGEVDGVHEGVGKGCQFWTYQRDKKNNIDELKQLVESDLNEIRNEFNVTQFEVNEANVLERPALIVRYKNEGWGNFIDYYILDEESTRILSLIYSDEKEVLCQKIFGEIVGSFKINND